MLGTCVAQVCPTSVKTIIAAAPLNIRPSLTSQQSPRRLVILSLSNISRLQGLRAHILRETSSSSTVTTPLTPLHRAAAMAV